MGESIRDRWSIVRERIEKACDRSKRSPEGVGVVAVSKSFDASQVIEAYRAGIRIFGENYLQEAVQKIEAFEQQRMLDVEWHFVGALQSNKARKAAEHFSLIHSLDRWSLASELHKASQLLQKSVHALVEVNMADEVSKSGLSISELRPFIERVSLETSITIEGLMVFPPLAPDPEQSRAYFKRTSQLAEEISGYSLPRVSMKELSMGVSSDFEVAVEEGATLVRLGTAIFGPRRSGV